MRHKVVSITSDLLSHREETSESNVAKSLSHRERWRRTLLHRYTSSHICRSCTSVLLTRSLQWGQ